jgi:long-subunit acyl-CoA synthetase (AMP-forming)
LHRNPNKPIFGTRNADKYEWKTYREVADEAEHLSYGLNALELVPEVDGLKVLGIRSKNRAEWYTSHIANMYQSITTVGIYDNQSPEATMFIINETEITTLAISSEQI